MKLCLIINHKFDASKAVANMLAMQSNTDPPQELALAASGIARVPKLLENVWARK